MSKSTMGNKLPLKLEEDRLGRTIQDLNLKHRQRASKTK